MNPNMIKKLAALFLLLMCIIPCAGAETLDLSLFDEGELLAAEV